jgi:hypothetical protein
MDVIQGVLTESDFAERTAEKLTALRPLTDVCLARFLDAYVRSADGRFSASVSEILGGKITGILTSMSERAKAASALIRELNPESLTALSDVSALPELRWALGNARVMTAEIAPRKKTDYEQFLALFNGKAARRIADNRPLFYDRGEKLRHTAAFAIVKHRERLELLLKGLAYVEYCNAKGITEDWRRAEFV